MKGQFRVFSKGRIIVSHIRGQWSLETSLKHEKELRRMVLTLKPSSAFAHMLFFDDWELHTPNAAPVIERMVRWCISNGMTHAAEIMRNDALKEYIIRQVVHEKKGDLQIRRFSNESEALAWLAEEGFVCELSSLVKLNSD